MSIYHRLSKRKRVATIVDYNNRLQKLDEIQKPLYYNSSYTNFDMIMRAFEQDFKKAFTPVNPVIEKIPPLIKPKTFVHINAEITNIEDLLKLTEVYLIDDPSVEYNINMKAIHDIKAPLTKLNNMIGMKDLKCNVVDQILYFVQDLHKGEGDFMHTVIYGPPGTGKTEIAMIVGDIYSKMGALRKNTFKKVTRHDLIAGYLGQTAIKTSEVITSCLGGVLFIDEAYALGNTDKKDSFSKECIDTLCEALSNHKNDLMVIIAGYEEELNTCFFKYNQGLDSRFVWRFKTNNYNTAELFQIFVKKITDIGWKLDASITSKWLENKMIYFKFYGRDIESLLLKTKIAHSRRVFCKSVEEKRQINLVDLDRGFEMYLQNDEIKKRKEQEGFNYAISSLYV